MKQRSTIYLKAKFKTHEMYLRMHYVDKLKQSQEGDTCKTNRLAELKKRINHL